MHARVKKLNPHANIPAAVKMNEINPKYENTRKIHRLLTNQNPGLLYKVYLYVISNAFVNSVAILFANYAILFFWWV